MHFTMPSGWTPSRTVGVLCIGAALTLAVLSSREPSPNLAGLRADPVGGHLWSVGYDDQQKHLTRMEGEQWGFAIIGVLLNWCPRIKRTPKI